MWEVGKEKGEGKTLLIKHEKLQHYISTLSFSKNSVMHELVCMTVKNTAF